MLIPYLLIFQMDETIDICIGSLYNDNEDTPITSKMLFVICSR